MLQLLRNTSLVMRYTICQQVISILHLTPTHVNEIASFPGWVNLFLWLLVPFEPKDSEKEGEGFEEAETERQESTHSLSCTFMATRGGELPRSEVEEERDGSEQKEMKVEFDGVTGADAAEDISAASGQPSSDAPPYRERLSAFLFPTSISGGKNSFIEGRGRGRGHSEQGKLTISSSSWSQSPPQDEEEEVWRTFTIITETIGYILWHSVDYERQHPPWKVWGMCLSSLDEFSSHHTLIVPVFAIKQRLAHEYSYYMMTSILCVCGQDIYFVGECSEAGCSWQGSGSRFSAGCGTAVLSAV